MFLDEILVAQKCGEAVGIPSICSAHPYVLRQTLKVFKRPLIETTCNQVNQYGGYTGMTPEEFVLYLRKLTNQINIPFEKIILGGDHLGPSVWQDKPADLAMGRAEALVQDYVKAGFAKIHLDCSMRLADDPIRALDVEISAKRVARLARIAEEVGQDLRYVIGTEVPLPGGAMQHDDGICVTAVEDARQTIEITHDAFSLEGLDSAWERVVAVVVQPGVEYGDDFVSPYKSGNTQELTLFIESQPMVYEVHSTDYQTSRALEDLVRDHFAILKVGPALTFAFREAVFSLALMENELFPTNECSNLISVIDDVMIQKPEYWVKYYHGDESERAFKRKYSFSDRIRYYWTDPKVQQAFTKMMQNLNRNPLPVALLTQYAPDVYSVTVEPRELTPESILLAKIQNVLEEYAKACNPGLR